MAAFVDEPQRFVQFVARRLVDAAMQSAGECGCREFASDALLNNLASHVVHRALGFEETERVVCFAMRLRPR
jgi:aminoglycoside 6'-N-acetyltransferase I